MLLEPDRHLISSPIGTCGMNRIGMRTVTSLGILLLAWPGAFVAAADDEAELEQVREKVSGIFNEIEPQHVRKSPVEGWYTIRKGAIIAYISSDGRHLLQGDLIDLDAEVNLSELDRNEARLDLIGEISTDNMIVFKPEAVKYTVSVFTDIDCTYCRRFHSQIEDYLAQGIEVRYLLYPRNGPASESWAKAEQVWCADDRNEALTLAKLGQQVETRSCDASIVHKHYATGQDVGLRGTPAIVLQDGTLVSGYLPPLELTQALASIQTP
jgi:thiol:disulfide interchange protein DsbC